MALTDGTFTARRVFSLGGTRYRPGDTVAGSEFSDEAQVRRYLRNGHVEAGTPEGGKLPQETSGAGSFSSSGVGSSASGLSEDSSLISATARGSFAHGWGHDGGDVTASGDGAFVHGVAYKLGVVLASADGSFASGYASGNGAISRIHASGFGSHAMGYSYGSSQESGVEATNWGSFASGKASNKKILASGQGAMAAGYAYSGNIEATADGAVQFAPGTNAVEHSVAVGASLRLRGEVTDAPANLRNGDIWVDASGDVCIHTGGVTKVITNIA